MSWSERALKQIDERYWKLFLGLVLLDATCMAAGYFGAGMLPAAALPVLLALRMLLAVAAGAVVLFVLWLYARRDPVALRERAPAWRLTLLLALLLVALTSPWWVNKFFH